MLYEYRAVGVEGNSVMFARWGRAMYGEPSEVYKTREFGSKEEAYSYLVDYNNDRSV